MPKNIRLALILIPIGALFIALGYWNIRPESFMDRTTATGGDNAIDFYVENGKSTQFQEDGKLHYELTATRLEHMKATDVTLLANPDLLLHRGTAFPSMGRSDERDRRWRFQHWPFGDDAGGNRRAAARGGD